MYTIYLVKSAINNKLYVGQTSRLLSTRFQEHISQALSGKTTCRKLYAAIRKYGVENFTVTKLEEVDSQDEANVLETKFIQELDTIQNGYNLQLGGYNGKPSEETRKLMSSQRSGSQNPMYGKHHSMNAIQKISQLNKGKPGFWKGKSLSQNTKDSISVSRKGKTCGSQNPSAKLTQSEVDEIRLLLANKTHTMKKIASIFHVSLSTIKRIKYRITWN